MAATPSTAATAMPAFAPVESPPAAGLGPAVELELGFEVVADAAVPVLEPVVAVPVCEGELELKLEVDDETGKPLEFRSTIPEM